MSPSSLRWFYARCALVVAGMLIIAVALGGCVVSSDRHWLVRYCNDRHQYIHSMWVDSKKRFWVGADWLDAQSVREQDIDTVCPK